MKKLLVALVVLLLTLTGCGGSSDEPTDQGSNETPAADKETSLSGKFVFQTWSLTFDGDTVTTVIEGESATNTYTIDGQTITIDGGSDTDLNSLSANSDFTELTMLNADGSKTEIVFVKE